MVKTEVPENCRVILGDRVEKQKEAKQLWLDKPDPPGS